MVSEQLAEGGDRSDSSKFSVLTWRGIVTILTVDSLPFDSTGLILCYYANSTTSIQQVCISSAAQGGFERVIFPNQRILFEADPHALLNIQVRSISGKTVLQQIPCFQLKVSQKDHFSSSELSTSLDSVL